MNDQVTVRFAPSPTGPLHIGGVRTALYNYLFAKKHGGRFIIRIEDTDRQRLVPGAEDYIRESLAWLGITFSEGVTEGGDLGPYRQSDRFELGIYKKYADQLLAEKKAYLAFDTPDELEAMRQRQKEAGSSVQQYNYLTRNSMKNSLSLSAEEVERRIADGEPYVVRMYMPRKEEIRFYDEIRKWVVIHSSQLDDKVLLKSDGLPTYHLANVVDDYLMGVTHVIRGEEWLASTPLHVMLYRRLGWEEQMPKFVHLPLILNPGGKGKLSKRQGDQLGFPVFPIEWQDPASGDRYTGYREEGYLPGALLNFLVLLGWNPGSDEEIMNLERMTELFDLERIHSSGTNFDLDKLKWFNQSYLREMPAGEILPMLQMEIKSAGYTQPFDDYLITVIELMRDRVTFVRDFVEQAPYFYQRPEDYDEKMVRKRWNEEGRNLILELNAKLSVLEEWDAEAIEGEFKVLVEERQVGNGKVLAPLRLALTGLSFGPGAFDIAALIGRQETLGRIEQAAEKLPH